MALKDKVKEWMNNNEIGGDNPWFDKDNTYYNLTVNQIIAVSKYLNSCDGKTVRAGENTLPIQRVMPRTSQNDYVTLCKPNYLAKDGSIKMAREIVNDIGEIIRWEALKSDMYGA